MCRMSAPIYTHSTNLGWMQRSSWRDKTDGSTASLSAVAAVADMPFGHDEKSDRNDKLTGKNDDQEPDALIPNKLPVKYLYAVATATYLVNSQNVEERSSSSSSSSSNS